MNKIKTNISLPQNVEVKEISDNRAQIEVYPFEEGYAITVAHPLRRVLLSSTVGYAPIGLKIEGIRHEFDTLRGMLEDVASFIINLKNIRFKIKDPEKNMITVNYYFSGEKELKGSDLENDEVEVITKDVYLATLNEDAELKMELIISKGIGFVPSEDFELENGYIKLDAFFTPVKKALYKIENVLIEDNPNYEKIVFDIETDGEVSPVDAFVESVNNLLKQFHVFKTKFDINPGVIENNDTFPEEYKVLLTKIDDLNLKARSYNCLTKSNIKYVGELALMTEDEIANIKNLGKVSLDEIKAKLEELGLEPGKLPHEVVEVLNKKLKELKD